MSERMCWAIVLCPLILVFLASLAFGPGPISAVFEAAFRGVAWVVAVWAVLLGVA